MAVSIKLLNISLVLLCILTTAFTCTYLAITSSNTALDDTKGSRDNSVSAAFTVGEESVRNRTAEYIDLQIRSTVEFLEHFAMSHRIPSMSIASELGSMDWDAVKHFYWHRMPRYYYHYNLLRPDGNTAIGFILKNNLMIRHYEDTATIGNPPDGYHSLLVELNYGDDSLGGYQHTFIAPSDSLGYPLNVSNTTTDVNWDAATCRKSAVATNGSTPDEPCIDPNLPLPKDDSTYLLAVTYAASGAIWTPPIGKPDYVGMTCITAIHLNGAFAGAVSSEADIRYISKHLSTLEIGGPVGGYPSRGRVFVTLRSSAMPYASNGQMLGASHGRTQTTLPAGKLTPLYASQSDDLVIRGVGSLVNTSTHPSVEDLSLTADFAVLTLSTSYAPEGEEFYYRVKRLADEYGIDWYVHVVIDRAYLLGKIDAKAKDTHKEIGVSEKHVDDNLKSARTVLYIAVVAVAVGLIALSTLLVFRIIEPLVVLEKEMAAVAVMRLEDVDTRRPPSALKEVRLMQMSFVEMIWKLVEYRSYMPASVLQHEDSDDSETPLCGMRHGSSFSGRTLSSHGRSAEAAHLRSAGLLGSEIVKKRVTLMACNIVDFLKVEDSGNMQQMLTTYLSSGLHHLRMTKGIPDSFSGDRLYASWNGVRACSSHRIAAYQCSREMIGDRVIGARLSIGIVSGEVRCGNMGCDGMKRFSYIGSLSSWVHVVERIGRSMECEVAVDAVVNEEVCNKAYTRMLQHVVFAKRRGDQVLVVHEALGSRESARDEEWMYQLDERLANDPYKAYNRSYDYFMVARVGEALRELGDFDDGTAVAAKYRARLRAAAGDVTLCRPLGKEGMLITW